MDEAKELAYCFLSIGEGGLGLTLYQPMADDILTLFKRFHQVFSLAYQRFQDIQKAEAQAREAQIEVGLERVRAKTMAMHSSDDVSMATATLFTELEKLGVQNLRGGIAIISPDQTQEVWSVNHLPEGITLRAIGIFDMRLHPFWQQLFKAFQSKEEFQYYWLAGQDKANYIALLNTTPHYLEQPITEFPDVHIQSYFFSEGAIWTNSLQPHSEGDKQIMKKFVSVFSLTFRRFLDLQKAEAQVREAQIEAALERVRAQTMAMHSSEDVGKCVIKMFSELTALGVDEETRFGIGILNHENENNQLWTARKTGEEVNMHIGNIDMAWHPMLKRARQAWLEQVPFHKYVLEGEDLLNYYQMLNNAPDYKIQIPIEKLPKKEIQHCFIFEHGFFYAFTPHEFQPELIHITKRFSALFEQTYRRYLDLVRAEAQAREAEIELALERVRARTMAMQHSDELTEASEVLDRQVRELGIETWGCAFHIYADDPEGDYEWFSSREGSLPFYKTPRENFFLKFYEKGIAGETFHVEEFLGEDCKVHYDYLMTIPVMGDALREIVASGASLPESQYDHIAFFKHGFLLFITYKPVPESHVIFQRFSKVFEQTYTRFRDLQKAEAQAREAKIEGALERIRSRSLAMHKSDELEDVIMVVSEQLQQLQFRFHNVSFSSNNEQSDITFWLATPGKTKPFLIKAPYLDTPSVTRIIDARKNGIDFLSDVLSTEENQEWLQHTVYNSQSNLTEDDKKFLLTRKGMARSTVLTKNITLMLVNYAGVPYTDEQNFILKRFGNVFDQSYTRFLDLQKAEEQARESQIEAALERVRSRSMAMHKSDELRSVVNTLYGELQSLQVKFHVVGIQLLHQSKDLHMWLSTADGLYDNIIHWPYVDLPVFHEIYKARTTGEMLNFTMFETDTKEFLEEYFKLEGVPQGRKMALQNVKIIDMSGAYQQLTGIFLMRYTEGSFSEYEKDIIRRFSKVFEQSYTRFLDLLKAEAQAREANIEAAMERVRGKAMAMHNSSDLIATAGVIFTEIRKLGIDSFRSGVGLLTRENRQVKLYSATTSGETDNLPVVGWAVLEGHEVLTGVYERWLRNEDYFPVLKGELLKSYYQKINSTFTVPVEQTEQYEQYGYFLSFSEGVLYGWSEQMYKEDQILILHRFKAIVDLTFRRYLELQRMETIALEALRSASLDRVRAEIASMRSTNDLERITPLIWKELTTLKIPFIRCGVFIMDEPSKQIHTFLSTPDGKAIAAFHLSYHAPGRTSEILASWEVKQMYIEHWDETAFSQFGDLLVQQGALSSKEIYLKTIPSGGVYLHCLPFIQGMLYVGNTVELSKDEIHLIQSVADTFSTAYARYEDFVKLEQAKAEVDSAMSELKATQSQLVQQEKLASLGQLTAGIAHEIKNPLNFVNNFSEVSIELLDEAIEERSKSQESRDETLLDEILVDIKSNLKKVHEHGSRANGIVTSMLQHSRGGSGKLDPTDLNALIKEYVNLSFHGMRASKNPIDVKISFDLDDKIKEVPLIKEDFIRVIINLCNNAFDAMRGKMYQLQSTKYEVESGTDGGYQAKLNVTTSLEKGQIRIAIQDNGPGIPDEIKDKILQPFFTTKKGTEGTGLGLSITHDIVKAHGGELSVKSEVGKGTEFIISLF